MEKRAIVTIIEGNIYHEIAKRTLPLIEQYAKKVDAELIIWNETSPYRYPGYKKLDIAHLFDDGFDRVLYIDIDIVIRPDSPDIFDLVPYTMVGLFDEGVCYDRRQAKANFASDDQLFYQDATYYNTGVMVVSKCHSILFNPSLPSFAQKNNFSEQTYLNYVIHQIKPAIFKLPHRFNRLSIVSKITGENYLDSYFLHFAGVFSIDKSTNQIMAGLSMVDKVIDIWFKEIKEHYPRSIFIETAGGLGDIVSTEPVIRYMKEKIYPRDIMVVKTNFPEVFDHLIDFLKLGPDESIPDTGYYEIYLMPKPESIHTRVITHSICHPIDYASICAFKGQLPFDESRRIKIRTQCPDELKMKPSIVVHAGRHWASKTFPASYWQAIVDGLIDADIPVILVGKDTEGASHGYVPIDGHRCLDLRDRLSIQELAYILENNPVLLSNDSSPVHIAGAFDNEIILIQSCKASHHILPWRYGTQSFKTTVLGRLIDFPIAPNSMVEVRIDDFRSEDLMMFLPSIDEVIEVAKEKFHESL